MDHTRFAFLIFLAQVVGSAFYIVFFLSYLLGLPSTDNLIGDPKFRLLLQVFGGLFLILIGATFVAILLAMQGKREKV